MYKNYHSIINTVHTYYIGIVKYNNHCLNPYTYIVCISLYMYCIYLDDFRLFCIP